MCVQLHKRDLPDLSATLVANHCALSNTATPLPQDKFARDISCRGGWLFALAFHNLQSAHAKPQPNMTIHVCQRLSATARARSPDLRRSSCHTARSRRRHGRGASPPGLLFLPRHKKGLLREGGPKGLTDRPALAAQVPALCLDVGLSKKILLTNFTALCSKPRCMK